MTGEIPCMPTSSDMTNTYTMFGVCGINPAAPAAWCTVHDGINDSVQIAIDLEFAIQSGAVVAGDFLVFDNAAVHNGGENTVLADHLWKNHGIYAGSRVESYRAGLEIHGPETACDAVGTSQADSTCNSSRCH